MFLTLRIDLDYVPWDTPDAAEFGHGEPATLHLEEQWIRDVTITTGLVDTFSTPTLLRLLAGRQLDAGRFVTHRFGLDDFPKAYEVFADAAHTGALKVVLTR